MNFNKSIMHPLNFSMIGLWVMIIVLLLLAAPKAHTRLTQDIYPQSSAQLVQQLTSAFESKQLSQIMRLFNWEGVAIEDVHNMKALWAQTLDEEVLAQVKIIPVYRSFETGSHLADYYRETINHNHHDSQPVIYGELKIIFKARQADGFLSTVSMILPYGAMDIKGGFRMYSVALLDSPAVRSN